MYAVVSNSGRQLLVKEGGFYKVDKVAAEVGDKLDFAEVLLVNNTETVNIKSEAANKKVTFEVIEHGRGKKINIIKFKRRKHHMKRMGHRQDYTTVKVISIK